MGDTGRTEIFGQHRYTILAHLESIEFESSEKAISLRPLFVEWRLETIEPRFPFIAAGGRPELWPAAIDQFAKLDPAKRPRVDELKRLTAMSANDVKIAFAESIGEGYIPKDWGGETSDLFTARLTVDGKPMTAAFAFKGPGLRGPLYIAGMGKRGDQAIRLASEPADL